MDIYWWKNGSAVWVSKGDLSHLEKEIIEFFLECWHNNSLNFMEIIDRDSDIIPATLGELSFTLMHPFEFYSFLKIYFLSSFFFEQTVLLSATWLPRTSLHFFKVVRKLKGKVVLLVGEKSSPVHDPEDAPFKWKRVQKDHKKAVLKEVVNRRQQGILPTSL